MQFRFDAVDLPASVRELREEIRGFLAAEMPALAPERRANSWAQFDAAFSRKLGARGWIGMVWPKRFGGHERSPLERYVVLEELLAAGAPVAAHWIADRQSGMAILRYGNEAQAQKWLPGMGRGEIYTCIGMSEPGSGSDLASVRTRATKVDGGWRIRGQKIWTTHANDCQLMIALVRTRPEAEKHAGLSQFLIEMSTPGVRVRPIVDLVGDAHFAEVFFDDAFLPDGALLGPEGAGWKQVTGELSLERSGPERYLSSFALFVELLRAAGPQPSEAVRALLGRTTAQLWTLRQMSLSVAGQLAAGRDPMLEAAVVKDLGNALEQELPRLVQAALDEELASASDLARVLAYLLQVAPSFSLRGGTREILRGIIARGLGLR
ncbi:MAG: acyl-CoA dehydrogenase family protein [Deltaproteobacteria bacterium]|nr:acyl-CoA dehydrogenase family protein [Deltaproteobacteria bacterium]